MSVPLTLKETAAALGISYVRVWQVERRAIEKLRAAILADPELREYVRDEMGVEVNQK